MTQEPEVPLTRDVKLNLYQRIHAVMADLSYIQKDPKKQGLQFSYAGHDKVTAAVREVCVKHGLVLLPSVATFTQDGNRTEILLRTKLVNIDEPAEFEEIFSVGYGVDPQDKGPGKGVSYAFKYALLKAFCLETGDDPDKDQASEFDHKGSGNRTSTSAPPSPPQDKAETAGELHIRIKAQTIKRLTEVMGNEYAQQFVGDHLATCRTNKMPIGEVTESLKILQPVKKG